MKSAITDFVDRVTTAASAGFVPPEERIAVFDSDGTLSCEKPIPIELGFILKRPARAAERDPALRSRQPWNAAVTRDHAWLSEAITKYYQGDDSDVKVLIAGTLAGPAAPGDCKLELTFADCVGARSAWRSSSCRYDALRRTTTMDGRTWSRPKAQRPRAATSRSDRKRRAPASSSFATGRFSPVLPSSGSRSCNSSARRRKSSD